MEGADEVLAGSVGFQLTLVPPYRHVAEAIPDVPAQA
jgi:hypothetical protein